jgi:hypothetical protein
MATKRKKGLSVDEKRAVMLGLCHDTKEVFNLKELESKGAKLGVVQQTIKDIVQSLVDDKLVCQDKIGSGNFFWSFPAQAFVEAKARCDGLEAALARDAAAVLEVEGRLKALEAQKGGAAAAAARAAGLARVEELRARAAALDKELAAHADNDPEVLTALLAKAKAAKGAADRWTDNTWALKSYLVKKFGRDPKEADKLLCITDGFDYVE